MDILSFSNSSTKFSRWPPLLGLLTYHISRCFACCGAWVITLRSQPGVHLVLIHAVLWVSLVHCYFVSRGNSIYNILAGTVAIWGIILPIGVFCSFLPLVLHFIIVFIWSISYMTKCDICYTIFKYIPILAPYCTF